MNIQCLEVSTVRRSIALQPLSRAHHRSLVQALRLQKAVSLDDEWQALWQQARMERDQLLEHFMAEERSFTPLLAENPLLKERMLEDHQQMLGLLVQDGKDAAEAYAHALRLHVRFEERELFSYLQQHFSDVQLEQALQ